MTLSKAKWPDTSVVASPLHHGIACGVSPIRSYDRLIGSPAPGRLPIRRVPSIRPHGSIVSTYLDACVALMFCSAKPRSCNTRIVYGGSCGER